MSLGMVSSTAAVADEGHFLKLEGVSSHKDQTTIKLQGADTVKGQQTIKVQGTGVHKMGGTAIQKGTSPQ